MRFRTTPVSVLASKVDRPVEAETTIGKDINPLSLEVSWGIDNADITTLDEIVGDEEILLIGGDLDVVGTDDALVFVGVVKALDVVQVRDVKSSDVVAECQGEVGELAVVADVGVDGEVVAGARTEIEE